jgi:adenylate cyclase
MSRDEVGTLARLKACRVIIDGLIASHRGRIFNAAGDSVVADFASTVDAVQCAVAVQAAIAMENAGSTADEPMQFRIGVHVGDVMVDGDNLLGDGSTSPPGWRRWPNQARSASRPQRATTQIPLGRSASS